MYILFVVIVLLKFSIVQIHVNQAVAEMEQHEKQGVVTENVHNEESVLQKLLRVDRRYAILMVFDMLFGGIDTVMKSINKLGITSHMCTMLLCICRHHHHLRRFCTCWPLTQRNRNNCTRKCSSFCPTSTHRSPNTASTMPRTSRRA